MPRGRPRKTSDDMLVKSAEILGWALGGLEREITQTRERLSALTTEAARLRQRLGAGRGPGRPAAAQAGADPAGAATGTEGRKQKSTGRRRRRMSPEARKRISEMMKKRWAERRKRNA